MNARTSRAAALASTILVTLGLGTSAQAFGFDAGVIAAYHQQTQGVMRAESSMIRSEISSSISQQTGDLRSEMRSN